MRLRTLGAVASIGVGVIACVRTSTVMLGGAQAYPEIDPSQVVVFVDERDVPGEFVKVAYISAEGAHGWTSESGMVATVQREAAKLGANGVIINEIEEPSAGAKIAGSVFGVAAQRTGRLLAIRFENGLRPQALPVVGDFYLPNDVVVFPSPDTLSQPATALQKGRVVTVVGRDSIWATVRYAVGKQAYLRTRDVVQDSVLRSDVSGPCADSLYQVLRKKDVNSMSEREFLVFQERDRACAHYQSSRGIR